MPRNKKLSSDPKQALCKLYARAQEGCMPPINDEMRERLKLIADNGEKQKGVLSVLITLLLKKVVSPKQDIRFHQEGMDGGFSARGFDAKHVTPFLKENRFPYMVSGAGALTRSLEQARPYDMDYPGKISSRVVKDAFLTSIDTIQRKKQKAEDSLVWLLFYLVKNRLRRQNIKLIRPHNKHIREVIEKLSKHFETAGRGASRLPVLAIYAVYRQMVEQMKKYDNCMLCELQAHQSADQRSGALGDIQVNKRDGTPFEVVEIKHAISLTPDLAMDCYRKFQSSQIEAYYLLSTYEEIRDSAEMSNVVRRIQTQHGCQMIVNGIITTLRYYLRLINDIDRFVSDYADLVDKESTADIKQVWNDLWED